MKINIILALVMVVVFSPYMREHILV